MDIGLALKKPFSSPKNLIIGLVLSIIPLLNILTIPGYLLRVAKNTMNKDNALPGFGNFGELVVNSLKVIVVGIVYGIVFTIVTTILALIPVVGGILILVASIAYGLILMSAMLSLAKTGSLGDAFALGGIIDRAKSKDFIIAVIVGGVIMGVVLLILFILIGIIFGAALIGGIMTLMNTTDPATVTATVSALLGTAAIGLAVLWIFVYILEVFYYSLVAESYPA